MAGGLVNKMVKKIYECEKCGEDCFDTLEEARIHERDCDYE